MPKRKSGLTMARHREIGAELRVMRDTLVTLAVEIGNAYPVTSRHYGVGERAWTAVDRLRSRLDSAMFVEHPDEASTKVYYGGRPDSGVRKDPAPAERVTPWWAR